MSERCKALTKSGSQCKRDAIDDAIYCGLHRDYEEVEIEVVDVQPNQYEILIMSVGANADPNTGIFDRMGVANRLQQSYNDGYELDHISRFDRVPKSGDTQEHFWVMFVLKRRA